MADCCFGRTAKSGYHGYNHQPLVLPNTDYGDEYAYAAVAKNRRAVVASLRELIAFQKVRAAGAPQRRYMCRRPNILSKEGRADISDETCREIRTIASTYLPSDSNLPYVQEFGVADDGIVGGAAHRLRRHGGRPTCGSPQNPN
ncbi:MAG: DUF2194 domain-containing protein [Bifidobacterium adolescentis]